MWLLHMVSNIKRGRRLRIFENRVLWRILNIHENREWRLLYSEEARSLCRSPNIVRVTKSGRGRREWHVDRMEEDRSSLKIFKLICRHLGRPRGRWEDNVRIVIKEIWIINRNQINSSQDEDYWKALKNSELNFRVLHDIK